MDTNDGGQTAPTGSAAPKNFDLSINSYNLFTVPAWTVDLGFLAPHREAMLTDILGLYDDPGPAPGYEHGDHTMPVLQDFPGEHWKSFFTAITSVASAVSPEQDERWSIKSWGLRYPVPENDIADEASAVGQVHHHAPAMFTSVFHLQLPDAGFEPMQLGTRFENPIPGMGDLFGQNVTILPAAPLQLLLFPGNINHASKKPFAGVVGPDRIIIVTDLFMTYGNRGWEPSRPGFAAGS